MNRRLAREMEKVRRRQSRARLRRMYRTLRIPFDQDPWSLLDQAWRELAAYVRGEHEGKPVSAFDERVNGEPDLARVVGGDAGGKQADQRRGDTLAGEQGDDQVLDRSEPLLGSEGRAFLHAGDQVLRDGEWDRAPSPDDDQ